MMRHLASAAVRSARATTPGGRPDARRPAARSAAMRVASPVSVACRVSQPSLRRLATAPGTGP
eukprot:8173443-Heterocapsa_arctica.AAC.1